MVIFLTLLFGALGYIIYKSKDEVQLVEDDQLDIAHEKLEKEDLYKNLEDLFI